MVIRDIKPIEVDLTAFRNLSSIFMLGLMAEAPLGILLLLHEALNQH